ncbi:hypothetical protein A7K95_09695 [Pediococcus parvulus]|uniref:Zinc-binding dehydrogenase n=1 Tax=Pediococcus parvulus TaxID=54062 RepID=A0AAP5WET2_9LACO|nr:zinc-binding dehydrogenase [Pediococcus parvulus]MDV7693982.1 zinc-binding dehydrogenase [Pediococcus parvulus]OAD63405.1 hypothetical protein A7K95_09695 [Pediococcus parvulus]
MKQIVQRSFDGIEALKIESGDSPKKSPFSAIIETKYVPILPWDWMGEAGQLQSIHSVQLPKVIGYSFSGIVKDVGALRNRKLIDQPVFGANPSGTASEIINSLIPPIIFPIPTNVSLKQAATIIGGADTVWHAVYDVLSISKADRVLVIGASGGVGQYAVQMAKMQKATVIGIASKNSQNFVLQLGADDAIAYDDNFVRDVKSMGKVTKIIDAVGNSHLLTQILKEQDDVTVLSLSQTNFEAPKINQSFQFNNGRIALKQYTQIVNLIGNGDLMAYIHQVFPFEDVIKAQEITKTGHAKGRSLLAFNAH